MKKKYPKTYIYGKNVVREALLRAPQIIKAIYLSPQMSDSKLGSLVYKSKIPVEKIDPRRVSSQVEGNAPHQGIIAQVNLHQLAVPFEEFAQTLSPDASQMFVYLDGVQDPHNVGTIIRASAAFGARAVFIPEHGTSSITPGVAKASAGALFSVPVVLVKNPQQALAELRRKKITIYGMAGEGVLDIHKEQFAGSTLFVLGNEGDGISPATRALCEKMLRIPIHADVESLNVASAATVALFAWSTKHPLV